MKTWQQVLAGVILGLIFAAVILLLLGSRTSSPITLVGPPTPAPITIHIIGEVVSPGVYLLPSSSRVMNAVDAAGGLTENADQSRINLAAFLSDGQKITIPSTLDNHSLITPVPSTTQPEIQVQYPININTASLAELDALPGIGEGKAVAIIEYRDKNGFFSKIEDIMNVSGIGETIFEQIKSLITIE